MGVYVSGEALYDPRRSSVVVRPGPEPVATDGPFTETKEAIGGFYVIDVATGSRRSRSRTRSRSALDSRLRCCRSQSSDSGNALTWRPRRRRATGLVLTHSERRGPT
jgi:hypothetical protein